MWNPKFTASLGPLSTSHLNAPTVQALEGSQSSLLMHATRANSTAGFAKACEHIFYLQKTKTGQNKGLPIHLLLSGFPYLIAIPSDALHSLLGCMRFWPIISLSFPWDMQLSLHLHLLPLMPAAPIVTCHQSFWELRTSFSLFLSLLCSSQFFTPVSTWEPLSSALNCSQSPLLIPLLVLAAQPCSVTHIPSVQPSGHAQCADGVYR